MLSLVRYGKALAFSALAEPRCAACEEPVRLETVFCPPCAATLVPLHGLPSFEGDRLDVAAFAYGGAVRDTLARYKYARRDDLARPLAALFARAAPHVAATVPDLVVPVPTHPEKLARRTFDPVALLARAFANVLGVPLAVSALVKHRATEAQASLDRRARLVNLATAFAADAGHATVLRGARVVLVDDVRTTGATLDACTGALDQAGAFVVARAVLAQTP